MSAFLHYPATLVAEVDAASLRWAVGKKNFQIKGKIGLLFFNDIFHVAYKGHPVNPDGSYREYNQNNLEIPTVDKWLSVDSEKFISDNTAARVVRFEFKALSEDEGMQWVQVTIPIKIKPSGVVEDPGKPFCKVIKDMFARKPN